MQAAFEVHRISLDIGSPETAVATAVRPRGCISIQLTTAVVATTNKALQTILPLTSKRDECSGNQINGLVDYLSYYESCSYNSVANVAIRFDEFCF